MRPSKPKPEARFNRASAFESFEQMERFDDEIRAMMERYEEHRHRSEVRTLIGFAVAGGGWEPVTRYLALARKKRGDAGADRLAADVKAQWKLGNRGEKGDWRE